MATLGIDGLVSGLDTTTLINQLMQIEAGPQTQLKAKQSTTKSFVSALQSLNVRVASLAEMAAKVAKPESWQAWKATSSSTSVTASASGSAQAGSLSFTVDSVASTQVTLTDVVADDGALAGIPPQITVRTGAGALVTIQPTSGSLADRDQGAQRRRRRSGSRRRSSA